MTLPQSLSILEFFEFGRFGTVTLGSERHMTPTAVVEPGQPAIDLADGERPRHDHARRRPQRGEPRPGDPPERRGLHARQLVPRRRPGGGRTGVLDYRFDTWAVQPTQGADYTAVNTREANPVPEVGGTTKVASFNVLNYFTTLNSRGANDQAEFDRQEAKIVTAIAEIDADIVGLIEIENNGDTAVGTLVDALNDVMGDGTYDFISTGVLGTDVITTALIYKPAEVAPVGEHAVLDRGGRSPVQHRPQPARAGADVHRPGGRRRGHGRREPPEVEGLRVRRGGDPDTGDGSGNCNITRTLAAEALADWLASDPTGQGAGNELIIGDLNSYDKEDPIDAFRAAGYTDLVHEFQGENAYSYVFDGQLGYLDYALAGTAIVDRVTGAEPWHINSDEPSLIDYDMTFKKPAQDALFAPDEWRSSDHDPVVVGLDLDVIAPELSVTASEDVIFPPNNKWRSVTFDVVATDNVDPEVTVEIVSVEATGHKAEIREVSDTEVEVLARQGAVYTVTFQATDDSGNATTQTVTVRVTP